ncbi:DsbA family oxidoreductase [Polycladidibacter stylochi]|uniref:DsbA family oxidoreductase n=1 Tax=Polycladidibacter stylochi TaxID=1807766 RepID=UPI000A3DB7BC|nr:DsbA family oxidoreductase [Pseudovibrio stylochi]
MQTAPALNIEVVLDFICPWSYIFLKKLDNVIEQTKNIEKRINYLPYLLEPDLPATGVDRNHFLQKKFGSKENLRKILPPLKSESEAYGIQFDFSKITNIPNTLDCHRVVQWLADTPYQKQCIEIIFQNYFSHGIDISNTNQLISLVKKLDINTLEIERWLQSPKDIERVKSIDANLKSLGIAATPFIIINNQYTLSGEESIETISAAIKFAKSTMAES